jgi:hypothetical protein
MKEPHSSEEMFLSGGRISSGVVRVGNTVRRPRKHGSSNVRSLLSHLEMKGFSAVPRYLGTDEQGRDMFTYIPGNVGKWQFHSDDTIRLAGRLLRAFHDATAGSELLLGKPVMCHHDPGPNNVETQATQVGKLASAYETSGIERQALFESILERQARNIQFWLEREEKNDSEADLKKIDEMIEWTRREQAYTVANTSEFRRALM